MSRSSAKYEKMASRNAYQRLWQAELPGTCVKAPGCEWRPRRGGGWCCARARDRCRRAMAGSPRARSMHNATMQPRAHDAQRPQRVHIVRDASICGAFAAAPTAVEPLAAHNTLAPSLCSSSNPPNTHTVFCFSMFW